MTPRTVVVALAFAACAGLPAAAQVRYNPNPEFYAAPYGVPVPGGVLQPDEVGGTSPSFQIFPDAIGRAPAVRIVQRCQYPDGWNVTDFDRDVNGIPAGIGHTCPIDAPVEAGYGIHRRVRSRY